MGFFDIFRKKTEKEATEKSEKEIDFSDIEEHLKKKEDEIALKDREALELISKRLDSFLEEFRKKIDILRKFDLDSRKADDNTKSVVKKGLESYLSFSDDLISKLSNIKHEKSREFIDEINNILFRFDKNSNSNYHRANILIGKELVAIREEIKSFSRDLMEIFNENKKRIMVPKEVIRTRESLSELQEIEKKSEKIKLEIKRLSEEIKEQKKLLEEKQDRIVETEVSEEHLENIRIKNTLLLQEKTLEQEIMRLKALIDFKYLTNTFHTNEKQMKIVKYYRDDFKATFLKDSGESLLNLLSELKIDKNRIFDKINEVKELIDDLNRNKNSLKPNMVEELKNQRESIESGIKELEDEKKVQEKLHNNLASEKQDLKKSLIQELRRIGLKVKD
jgi:hypothetical protein